MQERAQKNSKIGFFWDAAVDEIFGEPATGVTRVRLKNPRTGEHTDFRIDGVFMALGHQPNTAIFNGQLDMDELGYLIVRPGSTYTNVEGVRRGRRGRSGLSAGGHGGGHWMHGRAGCRALA